MVLKLIVWRKTTNMMLQRLLRCRFSRSLVASKRSAGHQLQWQRMQPVRPLEHAVIASFSTAIADKKALKSDLKFLCNGLRNDRRRAPPTDESLGIWQQKMQSLQSQVNKSTEWQQEIVRCYESAIAIACKQRQFAFARQLLEQMKAFGWTPSPMSFCYLIDSVGVELALHQKPAMTKQTERDALALVQNEERPHYMKHAAQRKHFHQELMDRIEALLQEYEATIPPKNQTNAPLNHALRAYAANKVPFYRVLEQMVQRSVPVEIETYVALLQCARWTSLPATISQLKQSHLMEKSLRKQSLVADIWSSAMKSILNSFTERFFDRNMPIQPSDMMELQHIYQHVDQQLQSMVGPDFQFTSMKLHSQVFALRVKAAAVCGLRSDVRQLLQSYVDSAANRGQLTLHVFLCALELMATTPIDVLHLSRAEVKAHLERHEAYITNYRRVQEADRALEAYATSLQNEETTAATKNEFNRLKRQTQRERTRRSEQLLIRDRFVQADQDVDAIFRLMQSHCPSLLEKEVAIQTKIMEQYMTMGNRHAQRLFKQHRLSLVASEVMQRVFALLDQVLAMETDDQIDQINELFFLALRTAQLLWRHEDVERIVAMKRAWKSSMGLEATLEVRDYDLLIFLSMANGHLDKAMDTLQELHNAGLRPSREAIHRIVIGRLMAVEEDMGEIVSFVQEWFNLHRIQPFGKTLVPLLTRLLQRRDHLELARCLQMLEAIEGLSPATRLWLTQAMEQSGVSMEAFYTKHKIKRTTS